MLVDLVELRDELASARNYATAGFMASWALAPHSSERAALAEVTNACREKLEAALRRLDALVAAAKPRPGTNARVDRRQGP